MWRFVLGFVSGAAALFAALDWAGRREEALFGAKPETDTGEDRGQQPRAAAGTG